MDTASILKNPIFKSYAYFSSILILKMLLTATITVKHRLWKNIFANPEDLTRFGNKKSILKTDDEDVLRSQRAHLNDLESIPAFLFVSAIYALIVPSASFYNLLMKSYTIARFVHTFVYAIIVFPQPSRVCAWLVGYGITIYMAVKIITEFKE